MREWLAALVLNRHCPQSGSADDESFELALSEGDLPENLVTLLRLVVRAKENLMHLEQLPLRFQKLSKQRELNYSLGDPASDEEISQAERRLRVSFPAQVKLFYRNFDGLRVDDPQLEVFSLARLNFASTNRLHFATLAENRPLYFDVSLLNVAEQWDIVTADGYRVTLTMASFWSNKIWAWVVRRRAIWQEVSAT